MNWQMYRETYGFGNYTGVRQFDESEPGAILLMYETGEQYKFTAKHGSHHVEQMKRLAKQKNGLNAYISQRGLKGDRVL